MLETIYLCRHGFRLSWESTIWKSPTGTPRDPPLSAYGVDQAGETATYFAGLPGRPEGIYSSPLYRCLQTAAPVSVALDLPLNVEFGVGEWYLTVKRGLHPRSLSPDKLQQWFPTIDPHSHPNQLYVPQTGESKAQVHDRCEQVLRLLIKEIESDPKTQHYKSIVIFTHAATNIAMGRALLGDRERDIRSGTCSIGQYNRVSDLSLAKERDGLGAWESVMVGRSCDHLKKGEERHWEFDYVEEYEEDGILDDATEEVPLPSETYKSSTTGKL